MQKIITFNLDLITTHRAIMKIFIGVRETIKFFKTQDLSSIVYRKKIKATCS